MSNIVQNPEGWLSKNGEKCSKCGSENLYMAWYDYGVHEGEIRCADCGGYVRRFDAG